MPKIIPSILLTNIQYFSLYSRLFSLIGDVLLWIVLLCFLWFFKKLHSSTTSSVFNSKSIQRKQQSNQAVQSDQIIIICLLTPMFVLMRCVVGDGSFQTALAMLVAYFLTIKARTFACLFFTVLCITDTAYCYLTPALAIDVLLWIFLPNLGQTRKRHTSPAASIIRASFRILALTVPVLTTLAVAYIPTMVCERKVPSMSNNTGIAHYSLSNHTMSINTVVYPLQSLPSPSLHSLTIIGADRLENWGGVVLQLVIGIPIALLGGSVNESIVVRPLLFGVLLLQTALLTRLRDGGTQLLELATLTTPLLLAASTTPMTQRLTAGAAMVVQASAALGVSGRLTIESTDSPLESLLKVCLWVLSYCMTSDSAKVNSVSAHYTANMLSLVIGITDLVVNYLCPCFTMRAATQQKLEHGAQQMAGLGLVVGWSLLVLSVVRECRRLREQAEKEKEKEKRD
eukprot:gnl/Dysnectes_brevis/4640_a6328_677.p1 GENE.gnl/Dysnectes_brevis/4640_a6328_677~~gnl/Dysnectes_brevis/4640_a6328_677.p1  ORF type:complete len:456 (-),score=81.52 gnl/Dysnectes_brevis/4640_a6328_677:68-1435(-)